MTAEEARALWQYGAPADWQAALDAYPGVVANQGVAPLIELDRRYRDELGVALAQRHPPTLEAADLELVTVWKMRRGEWRPRNLFLVQSNPPETIRRVGQKAFGQVDNPRAALDELCTLAGVGAATASAVLAAFRPDLYPFLDEVVGAAMPECGEPKFTVAYYLRYATALRERAVALGGAWTAQGVGMALWSAAGGKAARR